jgi:hypothetical protein
MDWFLAQYGTGFPCLWHVNTEWRAAFFPAVDFAQLDRSRRDFRRGLLWVVSLLLGNGGRR